MDPTTDGADVTDVFMERRKPHTKDAKVTKGSGAVDAQVLKQKILRKDHGFETRSAPALLAPKAFGALPSTSLIPSTPFTDDTDFGRMRNCVARESFEQTRNSSTSLFQEPGFLFPAYSWYPCNPWLFL